MIYILNESDPNENVNNINTDKNTSNYSIVLQQ